MTGMSGMKLLWVTINQRRLSVTQELTLEEACLSSLGPRPCDRSFISLPSALKARGFGNPVWRAGTESE